MTVAEIDKYLAMLSVEIEALRDRRAPWAERKMERWEELRSALMRDRRILQMSTLSGKRIE